MDTENLGIDEASIKNRRDDLRQELLKDSKAFDEITKPLDSFPEQMNELNTIRTLDSFNKITTWFLAISMGTLLWALSNFDKFRIPNTSPPIMPYKEIYTMSIILIGLSSIFLIIIQGILYLAQHRNIKIYTEWKLDYILWKTNLDEYKSNWKRFTLEFDSMPYSDLYKLNDEIQELKGKVSKYGANFNKSAENISTYILVFMYRYVN